MCVNNYPMCVLCSVIMLALQKFLGINKQNLENKIPKITEV
jgi:hypothetical protein